MDPGAPSWGVLMQLERHALSARTARLHDTLNTWILSKFCCIYIINFDIFTPFDAF